MTLIEKWCYSLALALAWALYYHCRRARARRIEKLRENLNDAILHDIKNPMTSVMGCLSCVIHDTLDDATRAKLLNLALQSCRSHLDMLEALRRASPSQFPAPPVSRPLGSRNLLRLCARVIESHGGAVDFPPSGARPRIKEAR